MIRRVLGTLLPSFLTSSSFFLVMPHFMLYTVSYYSILFHLMHTLWFIIGHLSDDYSFANGSVTQH